MKAVFKTRDQWFLITVDEQEPDPSDYRKDNSKPAEAENIDWPRYDLAVKNYKVAVQIGKRHAIRIDNKWLMDATFQGVKEGKQSDIIPVEISGTYLVREIKRVEPNPPNKSSTQKKGGIMK
jgi:hypothetical protein